MSKNYYLIYLYLLLSRSPTPLHKVLHRLCLATLI